MSFLSYGILVLSLTAVKAIFIPDGPIYPCPERSQIIHPCICTKGSDTGLYLNCENSNLASLSIALKNTATLNYPIVNLTIKRNNLERLYGSLFFKSKIVIVEIFDTPIQEIDEYTFYGVNRTLREFHLINSGLSQFPSVAFQVLGNLTVLNIDGHLIKTLPKHLLTDSLLPSRLEKLYLVNGLLEDLPIESLQPLRKLKTLDLHGNSITVLKKNQFKNLRDVEILDISFNNIIKIESNHIADLTKLGFFNASHNALTELARGTFARNSVLKVLNLAHNQIQKLDGNTFRGMRFLRRLYLNDNRISDIGRGTFASITRIGTIDLARNFLKKIDFQMFAQLNYIEIINVNENSITEIQKQSFKDLYLTNVNISHNNVETIESLAFENCVNITLDLSYNQIKGFLKTTFDPTTYALELQLSYNQFTDISDIPLHNMTGIKVLNVSHNSIEKIPKNSFPKLYELTTIDVSYNNISFIANDVFKPLVSLRELNFSHNSLEDIKSFVLGTIPTLLYMDLSHNRLKTIANGALVKLTSLRDLHLEHNQLNKLFQIPISLNSLDLNDNLLDDMPSEIWPSMNALLYLDLSNNRIGDNLHAGSFKGLLTLQVLKLKANGITRPPADSLLDLSTLQFLHLQHNNITVLTESAFGRLPVVFELNLYGNQISNISDKSFDGLLQLITLNISSNALKTIRMDAFVGLVSLRTMDLSHNFLERFDNKTNGLFDVCYSLESIDLSHNHVSFLTKKMFPSNQYIPYNLKYIDLSYNRLPVLTRDINYGTKKAIKINLSNNLISEVKSGAVQNLTLLEMLDLSNNSLTDLNAEDNLLRLPKSLKEINLRSNKIFNISSKTFIELQLIKKIDLSENRLVNFAPDLVDKLKNDTSILIEGNPLNCDCSLRPLKYYLQVLRKSVKEFSNVQCHSPPQIAGQLINELSEGLLQCPILSENSTTYDELPDIKFQEIFYLENELTVRWYVSSTRDIADFYLYLRNSDNTVLYNKNIPYDMRVGKIAGNIITDALSKADVMQVCVMTKSSMGIIGRWFESQCIKIPENFSFIVAEQRSSKPFTLYSIDPRKTKTRKYGKSGIGVSTKLKNSFQIPILIALINCFLFYYVI